MLLAVFCLRKIVPHLLFLHTSKSDYYFDTKDGKTECLRNLRSQFPLKMFVEGTAKKRLFWSDIQVTSGDSNTNGGKKLRGIEEVRCIILCLASDLHH